MRTKFAYVGAAAMVIAIAMFYTSGAAAYFQAGDNTAPGQSAVKDAGSKQPSVSAQPNTGGSVAGLVVGAAGKLKDVVTLALYWPGLLRFVGFPGWFASPIGWAAEILAGVGLAQLIAQRRLS